MLLTLLLLLFLAPQLSGSFMTLCHTLEQWQNATDSLLDHNQTESKKAATLIQCIITDKDRVTPIQYEKNFDLHCNKTNKRYCKNKIRHQVLSDDKIWLSNCDDTKYEKPRRNQHKILS